ncbi:YdcF family protein [Mycolicibacterium sp. 018/SC-01/001]|uniref:YdcF family protein n=1 Tax=Mycolicibacterium sp. 018/SC-01/001 TaxID=2592069 RepID=UPI00117D73C9|nr:YdcF family protein [Mycolicibacterium sp. 018/SC-01/001]TRW80475.1 YdcF family protein [Mycolicibacterium sp. 018/SC-01/001]
MGEKRRSGVRAGPLPAAVYALIAVLFLNGATGTLFFAHARPDPLSKADAIVVLGGEHDGREEYGIQLAQQGYAPTVLISDAYSQRDAVMRDVCKRRLSIEIICRRAKLQTTRGEALMTRALAEQRGWRSVIVISWRYHLPRARRIFDVCFASPGRTVIMRDVPRQYRFSVAEWQYTFLYQYGGWVKAAVQGACD